MDRKIKIQKLREISEKLKKEFIGIDEVIDQVIETITPWYVTPELIERPVVVSIWGLTGTGKTSVVRRLTEELELLDKTLFFDCGAEESNDDSISNKISQFLGNDCTTSETGLQEVVFVFDEFQYSRTIDEDGREVSKASQRSIWNLLDSGLIDIIFRHYEVKGLMTYTEELDYLSDDLGRDLVISKNTWPESALQKVHDTLDFYKTWEEDEDSDKDKSKSQPIISKSKQETIVARLNTVERGLGYKKLSELNSATTLGELLGILKGIIKIISTPRCIDCSKSLIFVIGNLDEAFSGVSNTDPDMDADVFAKITKKTGILDVKEALKERFRAEQIGRLGNNMIIYPSLRKSDFKGIIDLELTRVSSRFKEISGITIEFNQSFKDLLYSEGVYPSQGVRPVFTTIGSMCLPKLSKILSDPNGPKEHVEFDITGDLRSPEITVILRYDHGERAIEIPEKLSLGKMRSSSSCKKLAAHAIHEAGHAILMAYEKGRMPEMILAQSSSGGGYTYDNLDDTDKISAMCKAEVNSEIRICLAGNAAEHLMFEDQYCTIGCTSDWTDAWDMFSKAVYKGGFFDDFWPWMSKGNPEGLPNGIDDSKASSKDLLIIKMKGHLRKQYDITTRVLKENKDLLMETARYLVENRCMFTDDFKSFVEKYGKNIPTQGTVKESYWSDILKK